MRNYNPGELMALNEELQAKAIVLEERSNANVGSESKQDTIALNQLMQTRSRC